MMRQIVGGVWMGKFRKVSKVLKAPKDLWCSLFNDKKKDGKKGCWN